MSIGDKIAKNFFIRTTTILILIGILIFSKNILLNILSGISLLIFLAYLSYKDNIYKKDLINETHQNSQVFMAYKENRISKIFFSLILIFNTFICLDIFIRDTNDFSSFYNQIQVSGIVGFFEIATSKDLAGIVLFIVLLVVTTADFIKSFKNIAIVSDDKIIFYDSTVFDFNQITSIEYTHKYFSLAKSKNLKIRTKSYSKKLLVDLNDDKLKSYLEQKITPAIID